ncbi:MAG: ferrous iron transport protein B [Candidatus Kapabacteria bacterium]|nr:ferrous iron transport protein B [Candidatus Kapabacteria bacterium]
MSSPSFNEYIYCIGIPNSGKTTLFNSLTGLRQKVGNFHGVTIDYAVGIVKNDSKLVSIVDLPGMYSLEYFSEEEQITTSLLFNGIEGNKPDKILFVCDATNLQKGLFLFSQLTTLNIPIVVVITMIDEIKRVNGKFDDISLSHLLGCPVFCVVGHKGVGIEEVKAHILEDNVLNLSHKFTFESIGDRNIWCENTTNSVVSYSVNTTLSDKLDTILLHPIWGLIAFIVVMFLFFESIFTVAIPFMDGIETVFNEVSTIIRANVSIDWLRDLLADGIIAGVGSVIVFVPQIAILFFVITILEECGYLSRIAFLVDRLMGVFGLQGRAFIPLLGSHACAIPGIMSTRIVPNKSDRLTTILIAPIMTCSARLPVYVLLISVIIPSSISIFGMSVQGLFLFGLYVFAAIVGLIIAKVFKSTLFKGNVDSFLMELPPYRFPSMKNIGITVFLQCKDFIKSAGTVIISFSVVLWILMYFPKHSVDNTLNEQQNKQIQLEHSYAGTIGKTIQPIFAPLGFDWKITIGVIGSFAAREVFISTMGQIYSVQTDDPNISLRSELQKNIPFSTGISIIAFYIFALQCISTIVVIKKETKSYKWAVFAFTYLVVLAYLVAYFAKIITS